MSKSTFLANRLRELFIDGDWVANTNYKRIISDITKEEACKQIGSLNTIALLCFHVNYYVEGLLQVFNGGDLTIRDKYSFDMPAISTEKEWEDLREGFLRNATAFSDAVAAMSEEQIDGPFVVEKYGTYWRNIEGMIEHAYYHMGQLSLLKKLIREGI